MKNKKGFSLVEILAVIVILGIIAGIAMVSYNYTKSVVLEESYNNLISLIETKAGNYAEDNYVTLVNVQTLIEKGYLDSDDGYIYSPVDNEILNCYYIELTNVNGIYEAEFKSNMGQDENGMCNAFEESDNFSIAVVDNIENLNDIAEYYDSDNNIWYNQNVCLTVNSSVKYNESSIAYTWSDKSGGYIINDDYICIDANNSNYVVEHNLVINYVGVTDLEYNDYISAVTLAKTVRIDLLAPSIVIDIEESDSFTSKKIVNILVTDSGGSGVKEVSVTSNNNSYTIENGSITVTENGTYTIIATDYVGNESAVDFKIENIYEPEGVPEEEYQEGDYVTYLGLEWKVVSSDDETVTLILASNYKTGKFGSSTDWETSDAYKVINEDFLASYPDLEIEIQAGVIIFNKDSNSYVRLITENEVSLVSSKISNDSNTPFWTMTASDSNIWFSMSNGTLEYDDVNYETLTLYQDYMEDKKSPTVDDISVEVNVCTYKVENTIIGPQYSTFSVSIEKSSSSSYYSSKYDTASNGDYSYDYCSSTNGKDIQKTFSYFDKIFANIDGCSLYTTCNVSSTTYSIGIRPVITVKKIN